MHSLLSGIVGSTAYGLAGPESDVDRMCVFAFPTTMLFGLSLKALKDAETLQRPDPDVTLHEARKMASLILAANPSASELLWLPDEMYEYRTPLGDELIELRSAALSAPKVRSSYLGYGVKQMKDLERRIDRARTDAERAAAAKDARHLARIVHQGVELYRTGVLRVQLDDPQWYLDFGERVAKGYLFDAHDLLADADRTMARHPSPLPDLPDRAAIEDWLRRVRLAHLAD